MKLLAPPRGWAKGGVSSVALLAVVAVARGLAPIGDGEAARLWAFTVLVALMGPACVLGIAWSRGPAETLATGACLVIASGSAATWLGSTPWWGGLAAAHGCLILGFTAAEGAIARRATCGLFTLAAATLLLFSPLMLDGLLASPRDTASISRVRDVSLGLAPWVAAARERGFDVFRAPGMYRRHLVGEGIFGYPQSGASVRKSLIGGLLAMALASAIALFRRSKRIFGPGERNPR